MTWDEEIAAHRQALDTSFAVFCRTPHEKLLWLTVVIRVFVVSVDDDIREAVREAVDAYDDERINAYQRSGKTYRNPRGWTRFCGALEIDLISAQVARMCSRMKAGLLAELGIDVAALGDDQMVVVLHEHAIIDHRGHASAEAFKRDLRRAWPGDRRVHAKRLNTEGTVAQNLRNLADYSGKFRFGHSVAWDDRRTSYLRSGKYEPEWIEYVQNLYRAIGVSRLLNANITVQGRKSEMQTNQLVYRGKTSRDNTFQLDAARNLNIRAELHDTKQSTPDCNYEHSSKDDGGPMRASEIADYLKPETISAKARRDIENALARDGLGLTQEQLPLLYGDPERDISLEQQRLDAARTRAEIRRLQAAAALDRAEAHKTYGASVEPDRSGSSQPSDQLSSPETRRGTCELRTRRSRSGYRHFGAASGSASGG